jgi:hypothetical protein
MKKFILFICLSLTGLYFLGKKVQSSGTYTPSININSTNISDNPEEIANNIHSYFKNAFEPIETIPGIEKAWRHKIHHSVILSHFKMEQVRPHKLKDLEPKKYIKALPIVRKFTNMIAGISDWKLLKAKFDLKKKKELARFRLKGNYKNSKKNQILFYERHLFTGRFSYTWQLNFPDKLNSILTDKVAKALFEYLEIEK